MTDRDDGESDELRSPLRAIWLSMADEEPPERGLAELMAAARVKAEQLARPSWWQRLLELLRRPPVMALATIMILMGGAVFVVQRKDRFEHVPAAQPDQQQADDRSVAVGGADKADEERPAADVPAAVPGGGGESKEVLEAAPPSPTQAEAPRAEAPARRPRPPSPSKVPAEKKAAEKKKREVARAKVDRGADDRDAPTSSLVEREDALSDGASAGADAPEPAAVVAPADTRSGAATGAAPKGATAAPKASTQAAPKGPTPAQLHAQARAAAARGDCARARATSQRIAKIDAAYYRANVADDKAIASCANVAE